MGLPLRLKIFQDTSIVLSGTYIDSIAKTPSKKIFQDTSIVLSGTYIDSIAKTPSKIIEL